MAERISKLASHLGGGGSSEAERIVESLGTDGIAVVRNVYTPQQITAFREKQAGLFRELQRVAIRPERRKHQTYLAGTQPKKYLSQAYYDHEGTAVLELASATAILPNTNH